VRKLRIRLLDRAGAVVLWPALGLACTGLLAIGVTRVAGYQTFTILSGSMEPAIGTGDLVLDERISAADARVGDVITFPEPGTRRLITHRLVHKRVASGLARMRTKGDANDAPERWSIPADGQIGRVAFSVPKGGYVSAYVNGRDVQLMLVVVPALLLGILELVRIWRPGPREARRRAQPA
jgi:signal peptidase I